MKKIMICILAFMLLGCQGKPASQEVTMTWEGEYQKDDIQLMLSLEHDFLDGFKFEFVYNGDDMSDYATYEDKTKKTAMCAVTEDGYTLRFTLEEDKVIIEERDGYSYLDVHLSGDYFRK